MFMKVRQSKRILAILLILIMIFSMLPAESLAAFTAEPPMSSINMGIQNGMGNLPIVLEPPQASINTELHNGMAVLGGKHYMQLDNGYLGVFVSVDDGSFTILPKTEAFDVSKPGSFTTFQINGRDYIFGHDYPEAGTYLGEPVLENGLITTYWKIYDYTIAQYIAITQDVNHTNSYTAKIAYAAESFGSGTSTIAARILIDTAAMEGYESIIAPVPEAMFLNSDTTRPYLILHEEGRPTPNSLVIGNFNALRESPGDFALIDGIELYDAAAAVYFGTVTLHEAEDIFESNDGALAVFSTNYGFTGLSFRGGLIQTTGGTESGGYIIDTPVSELDVFFDDFVEGLVEGLGMLMADSYPVSLLLDFNYIDESSLSISNPSITDLYVIPIGEEITISFKLLYPEMLETKLEDFTVKALTRDFDDIFAQGDVEITNIPVTGTYNDNDGVYTFVFTVPEIMSNFTNPVPNIFIDHDIRVRSGFAQVGLVDWVGEIATLHPDAAIAPWGETFTVSITPHPYQIIDLINLEVSGVYYIDNQLEDPQDFDVDVVTPGETYSFTVPHNATSVVIHVRPDSDFSRTYRINKTVAPNDPGVSFDIDLEPINGMLRAHANQWIEIRRDAITGLDLSSYQGAAIAVYCLENGTRMRGPFTVGPFTEIIRFQMPPRDIEVRLELDEYNTINTAITGTGAGDISVRWFDQMPKTGSRVQVYIVRRNGATIDSFEVVKDSGGTVDDLTPPGTDGGPYTFTMPDVNVTLEIKATTPEIIPPPLRNMYIQPITGNGELQHSIHIHYADFRQTGQIRAGARVGFNFTDQKIHRREPWLDSEWSIDAANVVSVKTGKVLINLMEKLRSGQPNFGDFYMPDEDIQIILEGTRQDQQNQVTLRTVQLVDGEELPIPNLSTYLDVTHAEFGDIVDVWVGYPGITDPPPGDGNVWGYTPGLYEVRITEGLTPDRSNEIERHGYSRNRGRFRHSFEMGAGPMEVTVVFLQDLTEPVEPVTVNIVGLENDSALMPFLVDGAVQGGIHGRRDLRFKVFHEPDESLVAEATVTIRKNTWDAFFVLKSADPEVIITHIRDRGAEREFNVRFRTDEARTPKTITVEREIVPKFDIAAVSPNHTYWERFEDLTLYGDFTNFDIDEHMNSVDLIYYDWEEDPFVPGRWIGIRTPMRLDRSWLTKVSDTELWLDLSGIQVPDNVYLSPNILGGDMFFRPSQLYEISFEYKSESELNPRTATRDISFQLCHSRIDLRQDMFHVGVVQFQGSTDTTQIDSRQKRILVSETMEDLIAEVNDPTRYRNGTLMLTLSSQNGFKVDEMSGDIITKVTLNPGDPEGTPDSNGVLLNNLKLLEANEVKRMSLTVTGSNAIRFEAKGYKAYMGNVLMFYPISIPRINDLVEWLDGRNPATITEADITGEIKEYLEEVIKSVLGALNEELPFDIPTGVNLSPALNTGEDVLNFLQGGTLSFLRQLAGFDELYIDYRSNTSYTRNRELFDRIRRFEHWRIENGHFNIAYLTSPLFDIAENFADLIGFNGFEAAYNGFGLLDNSIRYSGKLGLTLPIGPVDEDTNERKPLALFDLIRLDFNTDGNLVGTGVGFDGIEALGEVNVPPIAKFEGIGGRAYVNTFDHVYEFEFNANIVVADAEGLLHLKPITIGSLTFPFLDSFYFRFGADAGIPLVPPTVVGDLRGLSGGILHLNQLLAPDFSERFLPETAVVGGARFGLVNVLEMELELTLRLGSYQGHSRNLKVSMGGFEVSMVEDLRVNIGLQNAPARWDCPNKYKRLAWNYRVDFKINIAKGITSPLGSLDNIIRARGGLHFGVDFHAPDEVVKIMIEQAKGGPLNVNPLTALDPRYFVAGYFNGSLHVPPFVRIGPIGFNSVKLADVDIFGRGHIGLPRNLVPPKTLEDLDILNFVPDIHIYLHLRARALFFNFSVTFNFDTPQAGPSFRGASASLSLADENTFNFREANTVVSVSDNVRFVGASDENVFFPNPDDGIMLLSASALSFSSTPSSTPSPSRPFLQMNADGSVHEVFVPAGENNFMVVIKAPRSDIRVYDPDGNAYPLLFMPEEAEVEVTAEQAGLFFNTMSVNDNDGNKCYLIALGEDKPGTWTILSSEPFESYIMEAAPLPEITKFELDKAGNKVSFTVDNLDDDEEYFYMLQFHKKDFADSTPDEFITLENENANKANLVPVTAANAKTGSGITVPFNLADYGTIPSGNYYPVLLVYEFTEFAKDEHGRHILVDNEYVPLYTLIETAQSDDFIEIENTEFETLFTDYLDDLKAEPGGNESIKITFSHTDGIDGYMIQLLDAFEQPVVTYRLVENFYDVDEHDRLLPVVIGDGSIAEHIFIYDIPADEAENGEFELYLAGMEGGRHYIVEATPYLISQYEESMEEHFLEFPGILFGAPKRANVNNNVINNVNTHTITTASSLLHTDFGSLYVPVPAPPATTNSDNGSVFVHVPAPPTITYSVNGGTMDFFAGQPTIFTDGSAVITIETDKLSDIVIGRNFGNDVLASEKNTRKLTLDTADIANLTTMNLTVIATTNSGGDSATEFFQLVFNDAPPILVLDYPDGGAYAAPGGSFTITGVTDPRQTVAATGGFLTEADGVNGMFSLNGQISGNVGDSVDVVISATNIAGNTANLTVPVTVTDTAAPPRPARSEHTPMLPPDEQPPEDAIIDSPDVTEPPIPRASVRILREASLLEAMADIAEEDVPETPPEVIVAEPEPEADIPELKTGTEVLEPASTEPTGGNGNVIGWVVGSIAALALGGGGSLVFFRIRRRGV